VFKGGGEVIFSAFRGETLSEFSRGHFGLFIGKAFLLVQVGCCVMRPFQVFDGSCAFI
jgi:hypothetical protein